MLNVELAFRRSTCAIPEAQGWTAVCVGLATELAASSNPAIQDSKTKKSRICQNNDKHYRTFELGLCSCQSQGASFKAQLFGIMISQLRFHHYFGKILHYFAIPSLHLLSWPCSWMAGWLQGLGQWASYVQPSSCVTFQDSTTQNCRICQNNDKFKLTFEQWVCSRSWSRCIYRSSTCLYHVKSKIAVYHYFDKSYTSWFGRLSWNCARST